MLSTRWVLLLIVSAATCYAQAAQTKRPVCNKRNQGMVWPANSVGQPRTSIEICSLDVWKYHWKAVVVDVSELVRKSKHGGPIKDFDAAPAETGKPRD